MTKTISRSAITVIAAVITVALILGVTIWIFPVLSSPTVDSSWWIVTNNEDVYNNWCVGQIKGNFGGKLVDISDTTVDWNSIGQNIIVAGGSSSLSDVAPWVQIWFPMSTMQKPSTFPGAYWDRTGGVSDEYVVTPINAYQWTPNTDYGLIVRGYDYGLRRWVIVIIGGTAQCSATGAKYVIDNDGKFDSNYVVYLCTVKPQDDVSKWKMTDFGYSEVESG